MKRILLLSLALSALLLMSARAQSPAAYRILALLAGGTNNVAASATNAPADVGISCSEHDALALLVEQAGTGAGTGTVVYAFAKGLDASTVETTPSLTLTVPLSGTNAVRLLSEPSLTGCGYLRLVSIQNTNAVAVTNILVKAARKNPRRTVNLR
ncbi:MAG TPA: hypothetical protein PKJ98_20360 [Verrucomicrobiota bacterium]|nr:hypothetical protein [Verrucomicrobiota bacterium]